MVQGSIIKCGNSNCVMGEFPYMVLLREASTHLLFFTRDLSTRLASLHTALQRASQLVCLSFAIGVSVSTNYIGSSGLRWALLVGCFGVD